MALNLDTTFKLKAKVEGAKSVQNFKKQLTGLDRSSKMSKAQLGKMNIEINRMARAAGNTTRGLRQHIKALTLLRDRTEIGGRAYKRLGGQIDNLKRKLKGLDGQAASTGTRLASMLATVGVGRAIGGVIRGASNYEEEVKKTAAIEGGGANFSQIDQSIRATAQVAAGTPQEVAELATSLARAGFDADQISGSLNGIVLGAEATQTAFSDMGSIVANNINAFGLEVSDTEALVDILVASANSANQTVTDLGESLKYAAPVAKAFGLTVNDTAATVSLLAQAGIKGSEAGTALRSGLSRLQLAATGAEGRLLGVSRGSQMLAKGMKALSSEILDANGQLKPMDEVLITLKRDLEGIEDMGQRAEITKAIFGQEAGSKFLALLGRSEEEITSMFAAVRNSRDVTERTREAMASFGLTTKILGGNFQVVTNQIGAAFIAVLHPLAKLLNSLLTLASKLPTPIKGIASAFAALGLAALSVKTTMIAFNLTLGKTALMAKFVAGLAAIKKGFIAAKVAVIAFNATNPVGWIAIAITGLITLSGLIFKFRKEIMDIGKTFKEMIMTYVVGIYNALPPFLQKIISGVGGKIELVVKKAKDVVETTVEGVKEGASNILGGSVEGIDEETKNKQNKVLQGMTQGIEEYRTKIEDVAGSIKSAMGNALQGMEDALVNFVMTGKLAFSDLARSIIADITRIIIRQAIMKPLLSFLPFSDGGVISNGEQVKKYAYGGIISRPTYFPMKNGMGIAGEAGAEAILPLQRGRNGKLGVQTSGSMSNIVVNVDASGSSVEGDEQRGKELGRLISVAIQSELLNQKRPGGLLA